MLTPVEPTLLISVIRIFSETSMNPLSILSRFEPASIAASRNSAAVITDSLPV